MSKSTAKQPQKQTPQDLPVQQSFADALDKRPLPLLVAEKWNFDLQPQASDGKMFFAVQDWIRGLTGTSDTRKIWNNLKTSIKNETSISIRPLDYQASDGKTYQRDYADDKTLYLITQHLRVTDDRPMLDEIRKYLAEAGALLDFWRLNPEKMLSAAQSRLQSDIERYEKAGYGNHPNILDAKSKLALSVTLKDLKSAITTVMTMDSKEWQNFHSAEIDALLNLSVTAIKKARGAKSGRDALIVFERNGLDYAERQLIVVIAMQKTMDRNRLLDSVRMIYEPIGKQVQNLLMQLGIDALSGKPLLGDGKP